MEWQEKRVLVFGTGVSGIGAADLLEKVGAVPVLYDGNKALTEEAVREKLPLGSRARIVIGEMTDQVLEGIDLAVLSPGVPTDLPEVNQIREAGIPIWGEIELAYRNSKGDVLAITGTNGKTTTTTLVGEIMKYHQEQVFVVGNIGTPYTDAALQTTEASVAVAEISSFQLETIDRFHPKVSAITNITPDHLNRHHTMEEYIRVKESITKNQTPEDTCVLNYEDEELRRFGENLVPKVIFISSRRKLEKGLYLNGSVIEYKDGASVTEICSVKELKLPGLHNYENVMTAVGMTMAYGVPLEEIRHVLRRFTAVEHRIEYVAEKGGVVYYNDSKGTNPDAAIKGIQAMDRPTVLIGGGYDKDSSYEEWIRAFDGKVKYLVLVGQTKEKIAAAARRCGFQDILMADTFQEAFELCVSHAEPGDAVLLSPACASWGMFPNYEVRGKVFKELVHQL
ncbi:MAG: UDP-N-acetylmuramoyl-L-alanine--D-glutamate ligase [Lachnospiraceae bacterium]|nr:UDP-N-acetylmuramoyl-L-alanine--D-glutamate ligase [Lachnospiraceae bacterium]